jgi:NAD(P)-dependent dehydrogenase (short-subunit alcohol dehydrogenase family)
MSIAYSARLLWIGETNATVTLLQTNHTKDGLNMSNSIAENHIPTGDSELIEGKSILVTGAGSGLGAALSTLFASSGAHVMMADIQVNKALDLAESLRGSRGKIRVIECDVGNEVSARAAVDEAVGAFGRIDVLINNAGTDVTCSIEELSLPQWERVMHTNLYGPFLLSKFAAQHMKRNGGGHIINIASTASKRAWSNASVYHASKWGLLGLSHALHAELRPQNIKVTAVVTGGMRTPFLLDRFPDIDVETLQDPMNVARTVKGILLLPAETVIPEIMVLPMRETSWP